MREEEKQTEIALILSVELNSEGNFIYFTEKIPLELCSNHEGKSELPDWAKKLENSMSYNKACCNIGDRLFHNSFEAIKVLQKMEP